MTHIGLAELVHPLTTDTFMSDYWQRKPLVSHGPLDRFGDLAAVPELRSIEAILRAWRGTADAWAPRGSGNPVVTAEAHQLPAFFDSGYTLYLSRVEEHVPALEPFARALELDLGLRQGDVYFEAFASRGAGSALHFDPNVTINVQLIGSKSWRVAENRHVAHPHMGWSVGTEVGDQMRDYSRQPFPTRMPRGAHGFEARAGTMVYLHPGYWHSTINHEPSLSLLYTINPPPWTELIVDEVRRHLQRVDASRELAFGLGSTVGHDAKRRRVEALIREVALAAERMDPDEMLSTWGASQTATFELDPRVAFRTEETKRRGDEGLVLVTRAGRKTERVALPPGAKRVLTWIAARKGPFRGHDAAALDRAAPERVIETLEALEGVGLIVRRRSPSRATPTRAPQPGKRSRR